MSTIALAKDRIHRVPTPEGISLPFVVASVGDRLAALILDMLVIVGLTIVAWMLAAATAMLGLASLGISLALLAMFLLWNFYFIHFEIRGGGVTPGKRKMGVRVISRDGGPLTAEAVFARNLMRNLELFLPLTALLAPQALVPQSPGWGRLLALGWVAVFALMPFFNQDRLRCGDLVAGTLVVKAPKAVLLSDLSDRATVRPAMRPLPTGMPAPPPPPPPAEEFPFTREQLDIYGIHELQVLEDLLRRDDQGTLDSRVLEDVCEKIKQKVNWPADRWQVPARPFLQAFYRAQRAALEQKMLFGKRQERKKG
ncbi:MAG TPA: RDD family protein [Thermoanaerobaculia bacterium]|nr:RDD family protein [Thermoanaerobaculia bacterium]